MVAEIESPSPSPLVDCRVDGTVGHVRLTRAEKRNAVNAQMAEEFDAAVDELERAEVLVATLSGAGPLFCAGADLAEGVAVGAEPPGERIARRIMDGRFLWICGLRGGAAGIGVPLALACPIVVAADDAWLWLPELSRVGVVPVAVMRLLEPLIGVRAALGLGASERKVDAVDAVAAGWISEAVPAAAVEERVDELAQRLAATGPVAVGAVAARWRAHLDAELT